MQVEDMKKHRMYSDLAYLWPLISPPEDYAEEAQFWKAALQAHLGPGRHRVLELGVGGGNNLSHLTSDFDATAVDLSEDMMAHSQRLNPRVEHVVGDMRTVRLGRIFDAVLIHDAIDYMQTVDDLRVTFQTAVAHLRPGGVFIVAPDYVKETFEDGVVYSHNVADKKRTVTYVEVDFDPNPDDSTLESVMLYVIRENGEAHVELDHHVVGLFPRAVWLQELAAAGFNVDICPLTEDDDPRQRELFVGTLATLEKGKPEA